MRYFFIDLENVRNEGLEGVLSLTEEDMVYIFYSENAFSMAIPTLESITNSRCSSKFIKTNYIGKNAMDFQIVSLFGATIERSKAGSFYIISKDNGFRSAVSFCESFFENYTIKCGVYPRIITAIAADAKNQKKTEAEPAAKSGTENKAEAEPAVKSKSRRRRRGKGSKTGQEEQARTAPGAGNGTDTSEAGQAETVNTPDNGAVLNGTQTQQDTVQPEAAPEKSSRRSRNRRKKKEAAAENAAEAKTNTEVKANAEVKANTEKQETAGAKKTEKAIENEDDKPHGSLTYIYELLGEFLSERTIDLYAGCIDEGIAKSSNRDELQKHFRESLGDDEGEALFKVVRSDYEKYKQARGKRSSHSRRRRSRKGSKNSEAAKEE